MKRYTIFNFWHKNSGQCFVTEALSAVFYYPVCFFNRFSNPKKACEIGLLISYIIFRVSRLTTAAALSALAAEYADVPEVVAGAEVFVPQKHSKLFLKTP